MTSAPVPAGHALAHTEASRNNRVYRLAQRLEQLRSEVLPGPGHGQTADRHERLFQAACEDVSFAKIAEAHWDALAILAEAGHPAVPGVLYAVWASEVPGVSLSVRGGSLFGTKQFCSGLGLVDRALVTVGLDDGHLLDIDVRGHGMEQDLSTWQTEAFRLTGTGHVHFSGLPLEPGSQVGRRGFYIERPGFWHGACGPAACWAGAVAGLLPFALASSRRDPHTLAHVAAMDANIWTMRSILAVAGNEIDRNPTNAHAAQVRAMRTRSSIEHLATDSLRRFARAFGPQPLAMNADISRRYHEADLFLRQFHGERDLERLGSLLRSGHS